MDYEGYYAILKKDRRSGAVLVSFPDHPHINTFGDHREHALAMAEDALNQTLVVEFERGLTVPPRSRKPDVGARSEAVFVSLRPEVRMAFLLRRWRSRAGFTQARMAAAMGISTQSYQRMERPGRANLTMAMLSRVARALGKRVSVELH
ncbi:MAG: type II toxin-antitoxin system HicB family antitoxin [Deltaproteobacteria bacterium]|nr:type II toxin-antitoxin system HicB family antitoxin [Deltaproteobacteria bacterium]